MASQSFGKYVASEVLGSGGMAEVYAGMHPDLGRKVAIKVILPQFATESTFEERFRREARVVASLRHPHIVQIYDFDIVDGRHFMVMEYLEGGTLKEHLRGFRERKAPMPLPEIATFTDAMASALDYAHARGAVHRDIKPPNILFTVAREPVLTDFGIAKLLEDAARLTVTGGVVGSPVYMPPEQATGGAIDARSDQYSLGVVLYEMVTGRVPFQGASAVAVMTQHLNSAPPAPRTLNATLPAAVEAVLLKVLAKNPDDRFGSVGEMAKAFRDAVAGRGNPAISAPQVVDADATLLEKTAAPLDGGTDATLLEERDADGRAMSVDSRSSLSNEETVTAVADRAEAISAPQPASQPPAKVVNQSTDHPVRASKQGMDESHANDERQLPSVPSSAPPTTPTSTPTPSKPTTQNFNIGGIQAGVVNQGGEQTFSGDLTFNLDFGDVKAPPPQPAVASKSAAGGDPAELAAILEALRRAFAGSPRVDRFVRLVTQFHDQLEELPDERANDRKQVVKRVQALLMEMTEAKPDPGMVEIMGASLERSVQPLSGVDPDLPTMVTRITSWVELMVQPE